MKCIAHLIVIFECFFCLETEGIKVFMFINYSSLKNLMKFKITYNSIIEILTNIQKCDFDFFHKRATK